MRPLHFHFLLSCGVAASCFWLAAPALAGSFIIDGSNSPALMQSLTTGEVGIVKKDGVIDGIAAAGIIGTDGVRIDNAGRVSGTDAIAVANHNMITNSGTLNGTISGINAQGNENTITNSGAAQGVTFGIHAFGNENTISNSGLVSSSNLFGIYTQGTGNTVANSGTASGFLVGIDVDGTGNTINNSGTASAVSQHGIAVHGNGNTITNSGASIGALNGIYVVGDINTITNSGEAKGIETGILMFSGTGNTISNSGTVVGFFAGIDAFSGNSNTIANSGKIIGGSYAVHFGGVDNTLTLLKGSNIQGDLALGGASNKLIIGHDLDTALSFTGTPTITTKGVPYVVATTPGGGTVYAVNRTMFVAQSDLVNDLTRVVADTVDGRLAAASLADGGMSVSMNGTTIAAVADVSVAPSNGFWLQGIGSYRDQQGSGDVSDFSTSLGGLMGGLDGMIAENTRFGIFGGFATGGMDAGNQPQDLGSDNFFGGAYVGQDWGHSFADLSVTAGWSNFDTTRQVLNNLVKGGVEQASGENGGFLFSPSLRVGTNIETGGGTFTPSVRVRYAGLYLDSYTEDGSAADLGVDSRNINIFDARGELAYTLTPTAMAGGSLYQTVRVGIDGTISDADSVNATLAGQALDFDVANDNLVRGYVGYDAVVAISNGASLNASAEAGYDSTDALTLQANGGLTLTF